MTPAVRSRRTAAGPPISTCGRVPFTFRIGVTGHRELADPQALVPAIHSAIRGLTEGLFGAGADPPLLVISMLAEGADRLVSREVLTRPTAGLEAVLPRPADDYREDFSTEESRAEFDELLARARTSWQPPAHGKTREDGYEQAGHHIVDRSDAVVALWDGEPARGQGGTATIVEYALQQRVPVAWVPTMTDPALAVNRISYRINDQRVRNIRKAAGEFRRYNATAIRKFPLLASRELKRLEPSNVATDYPESFYRARESAAEWIVPYFVRADFFASRLQRWFKVLSAAIFLLAAAAVAVVAAQVVFAEEQTLIVIAEAFLLVVLLAATLITRRRRVLDRWIDYRFLAERLRSSYFMALVGLLDRTDPPGRLAYLSDPSETWIRRALIEILARRPDICVGRPDIPALRDYLSEHWIGSQIRYHCKAARRQGAWETRLFVATGVLFALTLTAAILHVLKVGESGEQAFPWTSLIVVLSICLPAIGAAVHGIRTQAQFRRQCQRYTRMASLLDKLKSDMIRSESLTQIREVAAKTEGVIREENSDWFGVVRFHDMELIT